MVGCVVDGDVIAWLKKPHLANLFSADARGRDIGDGASRKFQARVGGVHAISKNGNSDSMQTGDLDVFTHQPLYDIQIVNHQVQDDVDVQGASRELADAMNLEINRITHVGAQCDQRRIEPLGMSYL